MKTRLLFTQRLVPAGIVLGCIISCGRSHGQDWRPPVVETPAVKWEALSQKTNMSKEEAALLEELEAHVRYAEKYYPSGTLEEAQSGILNSWQENMHKIARRAGDIGSTSAIQFFLDNLTWDWPFRAGYLDAFNIHGTVRDRVRDSPMGAALAHIKDAVPLQQVIDTLGKREDGTLEALMLEYIAGFFTTKTLLCG